MQKAQQEAVDAALKVYKSRVAEKVKHYLDTGDLCSDEAVTIRRDLELDEFLPREVQYYVKFVGELEVQWDNDKPPERVDDGWLADWISKALEEVLKQGLRIEAVKGLMVPASSAPKGTVYLNDVEAVEIDLEDFG